MKVVALPASYSVRVYADESSIKYSSSFQITVAGDRGTIHTLNGQDFYQLFRERGLRDFKDLGLRYVNAAVSAEHFRLIRMALRGQADVGVMGNTRVGDVELLWIEIREAGDPPSALVNWSA